MIIKISYGANFHIIEQIQQTVIFKWQFVELFNYIYIYITLEKWTKPCIPFPPKDDLGITNNYRSITIKVKVLWYPASQSCPTWNQQNSKEKSEHLSEKSIHNFTAPDNPSNHRGSTRKKSQGSTIVRRFLQDIWFHAKRKDEASTTRSWWWLWCIEMVANSPQLKAMST